MEYPSLIERAARIAAIAHKDQIRKEGSIPYIVHPFMVARTLTIHGFSDQVIAAGLVHDVLEDTPITVEFLRQELGDEVVDLVTAVTNDDTLSWEEKKLAYIKSVRNSTDEARAVAVADKIHNAESLLAAYAIHKESLWNHFNAGREKKVWFEEEMLTMLRETWKHPLVDEYESLVLKIRELV